MSLALTDVQCKTQDDCNERQNINCGICIKNESSDTGKCRFPFPYMFKDSEKCVDVDSCEENCNDRGNCTFTENKDIEIPYCVCYEGFYGKKCEESAGKGFIRMIFPRVSVKFIGIQNLFIRKNRVLFFDCYPEISHFRAIIESQTMVGTFHYRSSNTLELCKGSLSKVLTIVGFI